MYFSELHNVETTCCIVGNISIVELKEISPRFIFQKNRQRLKCLEIKNNMKKAYESDLEHDPCLVKEHFLK